MEQYYLGVSWAKTQPFWALSSPQTYRAALDSTHPIWADTLLVPAYAAALSVAVLVLHIAAVATKRAFKRPSHAADPVSTSSLSWTARVGGTEIFVWKFLRFLGCLALLGSSIYLLVVSPHDHSTERHPDPSLLLHASLVGVYTYASALALVGLLVPVRKVKAISVHLGFVLFAVWSTYVYRDVWPLATYTLAPLDDINKFFVAYFTILTFVGVVAPLLVPTPYIPLDPLNPSPEPAPEQTASLWSFMMFSFLDPLVWAGYRSVHLAYDRLPALADYDASLHLKARAFKHLDPFLHGKGPRHAVWGFVGIFKREYVVLSIMISLRVITSFLAPIGLNRLLNYLETGGLNATVKPWLWISWLFWGPLISAIAMQWYIFVATRMLVHAESIVTELVFEHALRIRIKEEAHAGPKQITPAPSETTTIVEPEEDDTSSSPEGSETVQGSESGTSATNKKKRSASAATTASSAPAPEEKKEGGNLVGKINNLVTSDLSNISEARDFLFLVLYCPLQIVICLWFLYIVLGWSAFAGLATMIATFPLPGWIASKVQKISTERMKKTDARIQHVTETMGLLRMIKLFAWENKINDRLRAKREDELVWIRKGRIMNLLNMNLNYWVPLLTMMVTYTTYTLVLGNALSASVVFSSMAVFEMLRDQLHITFYTVPIIIQAKVSLDRLTDYLNNTELLDRFAVQKDSEGAQFNLPPADIAPDAIGFHDAAFRWANAPPTSGTTTPGSVISTSTSSGRRNFRLRVDGTLLFKRGALNLVVGPTGSGKTSLLLALFGELHFEPENPTSWYQLPREGGVAYAAQEAWVQNETIKQNILFGAPYDEERYKKVLYQCALERDLSLFDAGDETEVGEKGLTLSGGQKARITLARAIYSQAAIVLLDDVLSALDVHTSKWIVDKCFKGDLVHGRTIILVTHNVALVTDVAEFVVSLSIDGRVLSRGTITEALLKDKKLLAEVTKAQEEIEIEEQAIDEPKPDEVADPNKVHQPKKDGKLIVAEEIEEGHVSWAALSLYLYSLGGVVFWIVFLGGMFGAEITTIIQTYFLGYWGSQYDKVADPKDVPVPKYLLGYGALLLTGSIIYSIAYTTFVFGSLRASRSIHNRLIDSILGTTLRWLDVVPTSRVITRCTQDLRAVDGPVSSELSDLIELGVALLCKLCAVIFMSPIFVVPGMIAASVGWWCGQLYIASQLSVKREMSNARSPVLGHFGAAITGLTSIRAYGAEAAFKTESMKRIDKYTRAARSFYNLNRWICIRMDAIGGLFSSGLATYLVYGPHTLDAAKTGFSLVMAVAFSSMILWFVRVLNQFEVEANSLERILQYVSIEQEPKPTEEGKPPAYWPASGDLRVEHLDAKYSTDGPLVLNDINFELKSGERVGVVGRTGSGKSSLTLSLLRCIFTSGHVYYDGLATDKLNLEALRGNITIIPQQPELLSGSLRQNLDPFEEHDDATLNDALRAAGLFSLQEESEEGRITLETAISSGGGNLSLGQRQIIALARAITRRSKVLILDEATAAVDYATDTAIQESIRRELKDVTLITVAHRLRTIMDADKIMVLDAGRLVEFDSPKALLKKKGGLLRSLVDESADKDELIAMANGEGSSSS
ncbi:P-loop containing nucleoside triphosphate hydrolase protein [Exidia glandulosa HHB12029]|uniref:p-loop containing nucleoside triphosphate hydrolase protein n=1 Tax=Exidia glandulosa HHB12029 TaxID=1314781 RepID=A0A165H752_EXIGL|nr:P-loop containing nucleoside triphosphate hydrolase protein [Exidia glandulosa HHB12029]